jgi:hypothetical protein
LSDTGTDMVIHPTVMTGIIYNSFSSKGKLKIGLNLGINGRMLKKIMQSKSEGMLQTPKMHLH